MSTVIYTFIVLLGTLAIMFGLIMTITLNKPSE